MVLFISFLIENKNKTDRASLCVTQYVPTCLPNYLKALHSAYKCVEEFYKINWFFNLEKGQRRQKIGLKNNFIIQRKNNLHNTTSRILRHQFLIFLFCFYRNFQWACLPSPPPPPMAVFSCSLFPSKFQSLRFPNL